MSGPGLHLDASADLVLALGSLTAELRKEDLRRRRLAASMYPVVAPPVSLVGLPALRSADGGPNTGYFWAVQRITVGPFGAGTDLITVYRGASVNDVQPQNALNSFFTAQAGAFVPWHVGGKGLILRGDESLIFAGTITGASPIANIDAHQGTLAVLTDYIL
jgi:hypothetical protein